MNSEFSDELTVLARRAGLSVHNIDPMTAAMLIEAQMEARRGDPITEQVYASELDPGGELLVFADGESVYARADGGRCLCDLVSCSRTNWVSGEVTHWRQRPHHYDSELPDCPNASPGKWVVLFRPSFVSGLLEEFMVPYMIPRGYGKYYIDDDRATDEFHYVDPTFSRYDQVPAELFFRIVAEHGGVVSGAMPNLVPAQGEPLVGKDSDLSG